MKRIIFLTLAVIVLCSCSTKNKEKYTLDGSIDNPSYNNKKLVSQQIANNQIISIDSLTIESGKFSFKGTVDTICIKSVYSPDGGDLIPFVYVAEKGNIKIEIVDNIAKIGGTPLNDKLQEFNGKFMANRKKGQDIVSEFTKKEEAGTATPEEEAARNEALENLAKENTAMMVSFAKENIDNILGEYCFLNFYFFVDSQTKEEMKSFATPKIKALLKI